MADNKLRSTLGVVVLAMAAASLFALPAAASWSLVWSDEFDGAALDASNWTPDIGDGCPSLCGWGNEELEYYRTENISVTGGNLVITAKEESYGGRSYTSGKVTTRDKHSFLYGRIEMRAKIPTGGGMWPAFWMMPQYSVYGGWAASGEIDIMEAANATTRIGGALHYGGGWPNNTSTSSSYSLGGTSFADDFHVYALEWEPEEMRWYVDGALFMTRTSSDWYSDAAPDNPLAPFDQEFYIILNAAVGGWYTGCVSSDCITADFPQQYLIDYVRVYEEVITAPPTVEIVMPAEGENLPAGDILIIATASDIDGTVARVEFYADGDYLGEDATAPYGFTWTDVPDGCYQLTVRAIDDLGAAGEDEVGITVGVGCGQGPYLGDAYRLPARIEAEDYDVGGSGVAYSDSDAGNNGSEYRPAEDVDIEVCYDADGDYDVGWLDVGEWLEYTVVVPADGQYPVEARVASLSAGGAFRLEFDGVDATGQIAVPVTGGWQSWTTVTATATLSAGERVMRFVPLTDGFNVNYFEFPETTTTTPPDLSGTGYALHQCYPNPFNPRTTIAFTLPRDSHVTLRIFDLEGREVARLLNGAAYGTGRHEVTWDGADKSGRVAAAGTYVYRLEAGGVDLSRRMMLVK